MLSTTRSRKILLRDYLNDIVQTTGHIDTLMDQIPHIRGLACQSLSYKKESIVHNTEGFRATYKSADGALYEITVRRGPAQQILPLAELARDKKTS